MAHPEDAHRTGETAGSLLPNDVSAVFDDSRVVKHVKDYLAAVEEGRKPDLKELVERFPEMADELTACLKGLDFVCQAVPHVRQEAAGMADADALHAPTALGDYRIVGEIGRGGMGVVYEAEQLSLGRRVALKVLPFAAILDPRQLQRFKNEAQAAASLRHPNIVQVYSVGCERAVHFFAMEYIEGQTLAEVIGQLSPSREDGEGVTGRRGDGVTPTDAPPHPLTPSPSHSPPPHAAETSPLAALSTEGSNRTPEFFRTAATLGIQAAEALEHAHGMGVVHRDVKPSNLMIDQRGQLFVTDFGLAMTQTDTNLTMTGDLLGTLRYMSPEQVEAKHGLLDHRTDVYSLGATLYELLTLQPAFPGDQRQKLMRQIMEEDPRPPRQLNEAIPKDLETIVLKATTKEPESRYATAGQLAEDLRRFLEHEPIRARRPSPIDRARKWARRHRPTVSSAAAVLLIASMIAMVGVWKGYRREVDLKHAVEKHLTAAAIARGSSIRPDGSIRTISGMDTQCVCWIATAAWWPNRPWRSSIAVAARCTWPHRFKAQDRSPISASRMSSTAARRLRLWPSVTCSDCPRMPSFRRLPCGWVPHEAPTP